MSENCPHPERYRDDEGRTRCGCCDALVYAPRRVSESDYVDCLIVYYHPELGDWESLPVTMDREGIRQCLRDMESAGLGSPYELIEGVATLE